jgi:hypothetical protein
MVAIEPKAITRDRQVDKGPIVGLATIVQEDIQVFDPNDLSCLPVRAMDKPTNKAVFFLVTHFLTLAFFVPFDHAPAFDVFALASSRIAFWAFEASAIGMKHLTQRE